MVQPFCGTPEDSQPLLCMVQVCGQLASPSQYTHLGLAQMPLCLTLQRVVESYREWTKLTICSSSVFREFIFKVKHLIAVVRHYLKRYNLGKDIVLKIQENHS